METKIRASKIACVSFPLLKLWDHLEPDFKLDVLNRLHVECSELCNFDLTRSLCKVTFDGNDWIIDVFHEFFSEDFGND